MRAINQYFREIKLGKLILWYYLIWYITTVYFHFDANPKIWINAVGISLVIGIALVLSVGNGQSLRANPWQTFRLFWMPFAVSSFSSLIKEQSFVVIFSPQWFEVVVSLASCLVFTAMVLLFKYRAVTDRH